MRVILHTDNLEHESDMILMVRAAQWLLRAPASQKNTILMYGENRTKDFYVCRNKTTITVRPCFTINQSRT